MKFKNSFQAVLTICMTLVFSLAVPNSLAWAADDSVGEKVDEAVQDTKRGAKKAARSVKDKGCELVNGKMECAKEKVKGKVKNVGDDVEDAVD